MIVSPLVKSQYDREVALRCDRSEAVFGQPRNRRIATLLAFAGIVAPIAGIHKFYLGQHAWGVIYLLLSWTPIPHVASAIEGIWYLVQDPEEFDYNFNADWVESLPAETATPTQRRLNTPVAPPAEPFDATRIGAITEAVRQLDQLRQDGLISEYEFEQKRRQLLDRIA